MNNSFIKNIYWLLNVDTNILPKRRLASRPSSFATHKPYLCVTECSQMSILNAAWPRATKLQIYFTIYQIFKIYFRIKNFRNKSRKSMFLRHIQKLFLYFERQKFHYHICEYKSRTKNNLPEYVALINRNPIIDRLNSLQVSIRIMAIVCT